MYFCFTVCFSDEEEDPCIEQTFVIWSCIRIKDEVSQNKTSLRPTVVFLLTIPRSLFFSLSLIIHHLLAYLC